MTLSSRLQVPLPRYNGALRYSVSIVIQATNDILGFTVALLSSLEEPHRCLRVAPRHTITVQVHVPNAVLCLHVILISSYAVPCYRLNMILLHPLLHALTVVAH